MRLSLNGTWTLVDGSSELPVAVPGCWEEAGIAKDRPGPFVFRRQVAAPEEMAGRRLWLRFDGVSYHAVVRLDGQHVAEHTGTWDAFEVDVTDHVQPGGQPVVLEVEVEKPASLSKGPASEAVPGRFPQKETLAGFLPYVWGHMFGGIWQDVWLEARGEVSVLDASVRGTSNGTLVAELRLTAPADVRLEVLSPEGTLAAVLEGAGRYLTLQGRVSDARTWSPASPTLYRARLLVDGELAKELSFGCRTLDVDGTTLLLNGHPIYPRLALSWGWYEESLAANPGREHVKEDLFRLKELGYNGVKLCLWVPPEYYFQLADELGMILWLELPMWLPDPTPFFRRQALIEYERIVRQVRSHPSLIVYSLGCELNREVGEEILAPLFTRVKGLVGDALVRDNSGSGEAYGGLLNEHAEYYDYHFYSDVQFLGEIIDYFTPRWRQVQPWLFGEFCDLDTFRDLDRLERERGELPWWTADDPAVNPQGARWQYDIPFQRGRLAVSDVANRGKELERVSFRQALLHRKYTLELVRTYREISGYVVTGERDTPISTAGMWDDHGEYKFPPQSFRAFNQDLVLALGWDKRRAWVNGGDRAAYWDTLSYPAGSLVRAHVIASNYSGLSGPAELAWQLVDDDRVAAEGKAPVNLRPGEVRELSVLEFEMPTLGPPRQLTLRAQVSADDTVASANEWNLWCLPAEPWKDVGQLTLFDTMGRLAGLREIVEAHGGEVRESDKGGLLSEVRVLDRGVRADDVARGVFIATAWDARLEDALTHGANGILLLSGTETSPFLCRPMPFWREAVKLIEPHAAWGDFPHDGFTDLQFFGMAADAAIDTAQIRATGEAAGGTSLATPILRRVDARTVAVHDYAVEVRWGEGKLIVSTLRFDGGLGHQPVGIRRNTAAAYLLSCWVRYLQGVG